MRALAAWLVVVGVGAAALAGCSKSEPEPDLTPPSNPDRDRAKEKANAVMTRLRADDAKRIDAVVKALATAAPRRDLGPCPIELAAPRSMGVTDASPPGETISAMVPDRTLRVAFADVATTPGMRLRQVGERITKEASRPSRGLLAGKPEETIANLGEPGVYPWEIMIVTDERREPRMVDEKHFEGGVLLGRAFLYSYVQEQVLCASAFVVGSSTKLRTYDSDPKRARDLLLEDLANEAERAATLGLVRAGPKLEDAGADAKSPGSGNVRDGGDDRGR